MVCCNFIGPSEPLINQSGYAFCCPGTRDFKLLKYKGTTSNHYTSEFPIDSLTNILTRKTFYQRGHFLSLFKIFFILLSIKYK